MINTPQLPPKAGYVEQVNAQGKHYYAPTAETLRKQAQEAEREQIQSDLDAIAVDHEYRLMLLELGVSEEV